MGHRTVPSKGKYERSKPDEQNVELKNEKNKIKTTG